MNKGSCLVPWFERSDTCPTCRQTVKGTHDNHFTISSLATFLSTFPDRTRDADELKLLELVYKPGQKVIPNHPQSLNSTILTSQINITNTYSDEDEEQEAEEEDEDDGITWTPCPCCVSPNPHNFVCPDPIPSPDPVRGPVRSDVYFYRSHLRCQICPNIFPTAWKPGWKCENCTVVNCGNLFQCHLEGALKPVKDQAAKLAETCMEGLVTIYSGHVVPANYINSTELALFNAWRTTNNVAWRDIGIKICNFLLAKNGNMISFSAKQLRPEDFTCYQCILPVLKSNFISWWIHERESTGYVDNRAKCWYGRGCRTQAHNPGHAARLIHACDEIPAGRRRNDAPARDGAAVGIGASGDGVLGGGELMVAVVAVAGAGDGDGGNDIGNGGGNPGGGGVTDDGGAGGGGGGNGGDIGGVSGE